MLIDFFDAAAPVEGEVRVPFDVKFKLSKTPFGLRPAVTLTVYDDNRGVRVTFMPSAAIAVARQFMQVLERVEQCRIAAHNKFRADEDYDLWPASAGEPSKEI